MSRWHVVERFLHNLGEQTGQPNTTAPEVARGFTKAILEAAQTVLPTERRIPRMLEWCESPETRAAGEEALAKRREARRLMKRNRTPATWKTLRAACKGVRTAVDEGIYAHLERYVTRLEAMYKDRDLRGLYKQLKKSVGLGGRQSGGQQYIKDEYGVLLRVRAEILQRWARFFGTPLNTKSPKLNPAIIEEVQQRPAAATTRYSVPLGRLQRWRKQDEKSGGCTTGKRLALTPSWQSYSRSMNPPSPSFSNVSMPFLSKCGQEEKSHNSGKTPPSRCSTRSRTDPIVTTTGGSHFSRTQAKCF